VGDSPFTWDLVEVEGRVEVDGVEVPRGRGRKDLYGLTRESDSLSVLA
jgi:hypothetical protein